MTGKVYLPDQVDAEFSHAPKHGFKSQRRPNLREKILQVLSANGPMPTARIHREFLSDHTHVSIDNTLRRMFDDGLVVKLDKERQPGYPLSVIWSVSDKFLEFDQP
jgi:hypothetical protein